MSIYKITTQHSEKIYIGSTMQQLKKRFSEHKSSYSALKDTYNYTVFQLLRLGDCEISLIEYIPDVTRKDLLIREQFYIDKFRDTAVNKNASALTPEQLANYTTEDIPCVCGRTYRRQHKTRHMQTKAHLQHM